MHLFQDTYHADSHHMQFNTTPKQQLTWKGRAHFSDYVLADFTNIRNLYKKA